VPAAAASPPAAAEPAGGRAAPDGGGVEWRVDPWRQRARVALASCAGAVAAVTLAAAGGLPPLTSGALAVVAAVALAPGYLAVRCRVDEGGVARRVGPLGWERRTWDRVRRVRLDARGLFVTAGPGDGAVAALRGLYLPLPATGAEAIRARLREMLGSHGH
jgi:hypothetical protein